MTSAPLPDQLRVAALACCNEGGDGGSATEFVDILTAPFKTLERRKEWELECESLLHQARSLLDSSVPSGKELMDLVGVDLPKVVVQYFGVSNECQESSTLLLESLASAFDPAREMFTAFFEAINIYSKLETLHLCVPLLRGLSLVFPRIRRRTGEFFKEAVPGLLELGRFSVQEEDVSSDSRDDIRNDTSNPDRHLLLRDDLVDNIQNKLILELIHLAQVIKGICDSVQDMERLRDILGIFTLQLLTVVGAASNDTTDSLEAGTDGALELMQLLCFSSMPISALVCQAEVDKIFYTVFEEEEIDTKDNCLEAKRGAALAVYWGIQMDKDEPISGEFTGLKEKFLTPGRQMVLDVVGLASTLLVPVSGTQNMSFIQKGLSLMTYIVELYCASSKNDDASQLDDGPDTSIQIRPALKRLQDVIIFSPSPTFRRLAFAILIKVISEVLPIRARFTILHNFVSISEHPSLVSLLLTCVKDEVHKSWPKDSGKQKVGQDVNTGNASTLSPFVSRDVLDFIQSVLRPQDGDIVELPANLDAVVGALNLYRYILLRESGGGTNYTGLLSSEQLEKGRAYWLLPLREQIYRVQSALEVEGADTCEDIQLATDCTKDLVYRCLEIVEGCLANPNK